MAATPKKKAKRSIADSFSRYFSVLYEDNDILVVNKQPGIISAPHKHDSKTNSLLAEVNRYLYIRSKRNLGASPIHRLDRDTSGVLLFAKSPRLAKRIKEEFKARKPERIYIAIVSGTLKRDRGTFRSNLATDKNLNVYSTKKPNEGKLAVTHFKVVTRSKDWTALEVSLETGRRNQIRVHFSEIGHPVLGDSRYKPEAAKNSLWPHKRLALHARSLKILHPVKRKMMAFESELPREMAEILNASNEMKVTT